MSTHCKLAVPQALHSALRALATIVPVATFWLRLRTGKHLPRSQRPYNPGQPDSTPVLLPPLHALLLQQEECSEGRSLWRQACLSPTSPHPVCRHWSLTQPASKEAQLSVKVLVLKPGAPEGRHGACPHAGLTVTRVDMPNEDQSCHALLGAPRLNAKSSAETMVIAR